MQTLCISIWFSSKSRRCFQVCTACLDQPTESSLGWSEISKRRFQGGVLIEHVHHQLFHIHTCADISFAADTIAAFLSRAQTWAPKPRLGHPAEKTSTSSSLVKRGERSCGDWLEGIEDKNRREIRRKRIGSGEKPGEDPAGPHQS